MGRITALILLFFLCPFVLGTHSDEHTEDDHKQAASEIVEQIRQEKYEKLQNVINGAQNGKHSSGNTLLVREIAKKLRSDVSTHENQVAFKSFIDRLASPDLQQFVSKNAADIFGIKALPSNVLVSIYAGKDPKKEGTVDFTISDGKAPKALTLNLLMASNPQFRAPPGIHSFSNLEITSNGVIKIRGNSFQIEGTARIDAAGFGLGDNNFKQGYIVSGALQLNQVGQAEIILLNNKGSAKEDLALFMLPNARVIVPNPGSQLALIGGENAIVHALTIVGSDPHKNSVVAAFEGLKKEIVKVTLTGEFDINTDPASEAFVTLKKTQKGSSISIVVEKDGTNKVILPTTTLKEGDLTVYAYFVRKDARAGSIRLQEDSLVWKLGGRELVRFAKEGILKNIIIEDPEGEPIGTVLFVGSQSILSRTADAIRGLLKAEPLSFDSVFPQTLTNRDRVILLSQQRLDSLKLSGTMGTAFQRSVIAHLDEVYPIARVVHGEQTPSIGHYYRLLIDETGGVKPMGCTRSDSCGTAQLPDSALAVVNNAFGTSFSTSLAQMDSAETVKIGFLFYVWNYNNVREACVGCDDLTIDRLTSASYNLGPTITKDLITKYNIRNTEGFLQALTADNVRELANFYQRWPHAQVVDKVQRITPRYMATIDQIPLNSIDIARKKANEKYVSK